MAGREVREYTNLTDPKDRKWGKGKDKIDDEDVTFQRMVAKGSYLITCPDRDPGFFYWVVDEYRCKRWQENVEAIFMAEAFEYTALDSDDLLYLKEQMEAEEDAERLLRRNEKRAFAAFKKAANLADSSPVSAPVALRVEPKQKSGIRQQDLLKKVVEIKPKRQKVASPSNSNQSSLSQKNIGASSTNLRPETGQEKGKVHMSSPSLKTDGESKVETNAQSLLGLAYASSDDED